MKQKLSDEVFKTLDPDVQKYILILETQIVTLENLNHLHEGDMTRNGITKEIKYLLNTMEESNVGIRKYEEGKIAGLAQAINVPIDEVKKW